MEIFIKSKILKKFLLSAILFLSVIIVADVIINFQIKKIRSIIAEANSLINLNNDKLSEALMVKGVENKAKKVQADFGFSPGDLKNVLYVKIQKPNLGQVSAIFQGVSQKYSSQVILKQNGPDKIEGNWRGTLNGFGEALTTLKSENLSLRFEQIRIIPDTNQSQVSLPQATSSKKQIKAPAENFIINFTISVI